MTLSQTAAPSPAPPRSRFGPADPAALARAEAALLALSGEFAGWMEEEVAALEAAWATLRAAPGSGEAWTALQTRAHDLKGLGGVYGHPLATRVCASLGRLLDEPSLRASAPLALVEAHVRAVRAVTGGEAGAELCAELEAGAAETPAARPGR